MEPPCRDLMNDPSKKNSNPQNNYNPNLHHPQTFLNFQPYPPIPPNYSYFPQYPPNYTHFPQYLHNYPYFPQGPMFGTPPVNANDNKPSIVQGSQLPSNSSSSHGSSASVDEVDIGEVHPCSMGRKTAKRKGKERCTNDDYEDMSNALEQQIKRIQQCNDIMKRRSDIERRKILIKEYKILMMDTSTMTKEQLNFHQKYIEVTKKNWHDQTS